MIIKHNLKTGETQVIHQEGDREHTQNMLKTMFEEYQRRQRAAASMERAGKEAVALG